jgi:putative ABC transport system substrate-binding protein
VAVELQMRAGAIRGRLSRRAFVAGGAAVGTCAAVLTVVDAYRRSARAGSVVQARIGVFGGTSYENNRYLYDPWVAALRQLGYIEGQNLSIEWRWTDALSGTDPDGDLRELAADLLQVPVDLILAANTQSARAAMQMTTTTPIVMVSPVAPVESGLVASLVHPGGNVTGVAGSRPGLAEKRLELLSQVVPDANRVAVIWNPTEPASHTDWLEVQRAASRLDITLTAFEATHADALSSVLQAVADDGARALLVLQHPLFHVNRKRIVAFATTSRLPTVSFSGQWVELGLLMAYGPNGPAYYRTAATVVDKVLRGRNPADLPVELPTVFDLLVNAHTIEALGLSVPPDVAAQVTDWVR